jgi:hypothetical protein
MKISCLSQNRVGDNLSTPYKLNFNCSNKQTIDVITGATPISLENLIRFLNKKKMIRIQYL